jgi:N-acetylglucosamine malate deacetylase 1
VAVCLLTAALSATVVDAQQSPKQLRIIAFGAHPDDNELRAAGTAMLWASQGHKVKFVSVSNGDLGHHQMAGGPLAIRRAEEVRRAARVMGIETQVLDIHDGDIMPTLENRKIVTRLIREWKADIVLTHRPNDYHPDHRYTGVLVQDASYMVVVPFYCPDVPALRDSPVFMYYYDAFQKPVPFKPDVIVAIDKVMERKLEVVDKLESQLLESYQRERPIDTSNPAIRRQTIERLTLPRNARPVGLYGELLKEYYGDEAAKIRYAESFEVCEYGRRPTHQELRELFPIRASMR